MTGEKGEVKKEGEQGGVSDVVVRRRDREGEIERERDREGERERERGKERERERER
jgi:hypothetical protein